MTSLPAPHARHKLIKQRLASTYSHTSQPTDHCSPSFRLTPWPGHTVLPGPRHPCVPQRRREREQSAGQSLVYVLGHIDREDGYGYTPKVVLDLFGGQKHFKISLDPRLVRSLDALPRPPRPLQHVSGPRPLTPPPGPIPVNPSQVVLDARELIERSRDLQLERQKRFMKRVRPGPPVLPDLWPSHPPEETQVPFRGTCVGLPVTGPPLEVNTLELKLERARQKIKNSTHARGPKLLGTLSIECKQKSHAKRQRASVDHLVLVSSSLTPRSSHPDIISLCHLREGLQKLKQKGKQRIK